MFLRPAMREHLRCIRLVVDRHIVRGHKVAVLGADDVVLDIVCTKVDRLQVGRQRVRRVLPARAPSAMIDGRANPSFAETEAASSVAILSARVAADGDSLEEEQPIAVRRVPQGRGTRKNVRPPLPCQCRAKKKRCRHMEKERSVQEGDTKAMTSGGTRRPTRTALLAAISRQLAKGR